MPMARSRQERGIHVCSGCGAVSAGGARLCPECGADRRAGWTRAAGYTEGKAVGNPFLRTGWKTPAAALIAGSGFLWAILPLPGFFVPLFFAASAAGYAVYRMLRSYSAGRRGLYARLLEMAQGDEALVERLIENERRRQPDAHPHQLMENALYRWKREFR